MVSDEELVEMSRPTMDLAVEAMEAGVWHSYNNPADIPDRHWERYGLERRPAATDGSGDGV